jgi:hypothetical protein
MLFDEVLRHPALRKAVAAGEERVGQVVAKVLASEQLGAGVRTIVATALGARETLEKGVSQALHAANLPSKDDVAALKRRLAELEELLDGLAEKAGRGGEGGGAR